MSARRGFIPAHMRLMVCSWCGADKLVARKSKDSKYCCSACRQAAYRARKSGVEIAIQTGLPGVVGDESVVKVGGASFAPPLARSDLDCASAPLLLAEETARAAPSPALGESDSFALGGWEWSVNHWLREIDLGDIGRLVGEVWPSPYGAGWFGWVVWQSPERVALSYSRYVTDEELRTCQEEIVLIQAEKLELARAHSLGEGGQ